MLQTRQPAVIPRLFIVLFKLCLVNYTLHFDLAPTSFFIPLASLYFPHTLRIGHFLHCPHIILFKIILLSIIDMFLEIQQSVPPLFAPAFWYFLLFFFLQLGLWVQTYETLYEIQWFFKIPFDLGLRVNPFSFFIHDFTCSTVQKSPLPYLNFALVTVWMICILFSLEDRKSMISKTKLKCGQMCPTTAHFSTWHQPFQMWSEKSAVFLDVNDLYCSRFAFVDEATSLCLPTGIFQRLCINFLYTITSCFKAAPPVDSKDTDIK